LNVLYNIAFTVLLFSLLLAAAIQLPLHQADAYIIGPGDQLELKLFDAPELSGVIEILNDGSGSPALLGSVRLSGLTLNQASGFLTKLYAQQLLRPYLQLKVLRPRPIRVALVGEIERPGLYSLTTTESVGTQGSTTTSVSGLPTLVDAIQKAGGITFNANLREISVQRRLPGLQPAFKQATFDLLSLVRTGDQQQNPLLFDGDTIKVGRAITPDSDAIELAANNLSPKQINVFVIGEVKSPGKIQLPANTPLVQAVLAAGGPNSFRANRGNVDLIRINRNGSAIRELYSINYSQGVSSVSNPPLRDGDTVVVNKSIYGQVTDAIGAAGTPLTSVANIFTLLRLLSNK
jgi:polysaccharide export outer membrane protein